MHVCVCLCVCVCVHVGVDPMLGGFIPSVAVDLLFMLLIVLPTLTLIIYRWHRRLFKWLDQGLEDERKRQ